jgi:hypothetical protein
MIFRKNKRLKIKLEDLSQEPGLSWRGLWAGKKMRFATITSVKFMDVKTLVCTSLLGRKIYLIRLFPIKGTYKILDKLDTTYQGRKTETDLLDIDEHGNIFTCNCNAGSLSQYRIVDGKHLQHVRDMETGMQGFIHGVKVYSPDIICAAFIGGPMGIHFYDIHTMQQLLHVKTDIKAKDVCFTSSTQLAMVTMYGQVTSKKAEHYDSEIQVMNFDIKSKQYNLVQKKKFEGCHFDCIVFRNGHFYINEQFSGKILIVEPNKLEIINAISGFDFPHGLDIQNTTLAVSNYGSNSVDIIKMKSALS